MKFPHSSSLTTLFLFDLSFRINPYGLVEIVFVIVGYIAEKKEAVAFLEKLKEKVKICDEAVWFCRVSVDCHEVLDEIC